MQMLVTKSFVKDKKNTLLRTNISPQTGTFEDDVLFPNVGYVSSLEGKAKGTDQEEQDESIRKYWRIFLQHNNFLQAQGNDTVKPPEQKSVFWVGNLEVVGIIGKL